ncbi:hypothetical protein HGO23_04985 [Xenorhabdus budapestensis]|uniref:Uncharacterized protein n=1 Tax=Xenorhabdus budapestensis TaxID=290110 RepID=A0ABX7VQC1_XENBU|nr:hypothetical protein [Xenorhabdus budapestensis]QTL40729.1 hypothetical protein HGO23_04985 [Xenorhabdus budapestensis]
MTLTLWCFRHHKVLNQLANQYLSNGKYAHTTIADWVSYSYSLLSVLHDTLTDSTWAPELLGFFIESHATKNGELWATY